MHHPHLRDIAIADGDVSAHLLGGCVVIFGHKRIRFHKVASPGDQRRPIHECTVMACDPLPKQSSGTCPGQRDDEGKTCQCQRAMLW